MQCHEPLFEIFCWVSGFERGAEEKLVFQMVGDLFSEAMLVLRSLCVMDCWECHAFPVHMIWSNYNGIMPLQPKR